MVFIYLLSLIKSYIFFKVTILRQPDLNPKALGLVMNSQQTNQGQPHVFFFAILSYSQSILYVTYLIDKSIFTTFTNVILGFPLPFFHSLNFNQLTLPHWCINRCSPHMSKTSQAILPHLFINRGHHYLYANFLITNSIFPCIFHLSIFTFSFYEHFAS